MADPLESDKVLLERLNALKGTSITLDSPSKSVPASATIEKAKPPSKEDALSDRLKSLRNQLGAESPSTGAKAPHLQSDSVLPSYLTAQPAQEQPNDSNKEDPGNEDHLEGANLGVPPTSGAAAPPVGRENVEPLLDTDDQTLEELLADLAEDEEWLDELASEKEDEHRRVTALLEELSKAPSNDIGQEDEASHVRKPQENESDGDTDDDDDSERGDLTRETEDVLARALDEVELEKSRQSTAIDTGNTTPPAADQAGQEDTGAAPSSQPTRPQDLPSSGDSFALPAVPSQLQDQSDDNISETDDDFEASITSRMAALRVGSGGNAPDGPALPSAPATDVNALGLPGAPTFAPHDRPVPGLLRTRRGFTDDDEKSWCVVCLEDATVRCRGCDDDVYCARCWKEMHVGPRAGYEERGHRWEKFVKP